MDTRVKVLFTQQGTWGGVGFVGILHYRRKNAFDIAEMLGMELDTTESELEPVIEITEGPEQYLGLTLNPVDQFPGLFAPGYNHPLAGKCYTGSMMVGDNAKDLKQYSLPSAVFSGPISYLHIDDADELDGAQKALLLDAVRFDKKNHFPAGASVTKLFTRDELEGEAKGKIFYAQ